MRHLQPAAHLGVQCIHAFACITKPVWVNQSPKYSVLPGALGSIPWAKDLPKLEDSRDQPVVRSITPSLAFLDTGQDKQTKSRCRQCTQQGSKQASKSVSQNRLQIWPLHVSQPPPASRDTVAVGADPGSEISITLGTDCTATTVPYHTGSREILPFRTRAAVCHLYTTAQITVHYRHADMQQQASRQHAPRLGPPRRPGHT